MAKKKQAPEDAETYRRFIKQFVDEISDANALWTIYTIAMRRWSRETSK